MSTFDENLFDRNVAISTYNVHQRNVSKRQQYVSWISEYRIHLQIMYDISGLKCSFNDFCSFMFRNS